MSDKALNQGQDILAADSNITWKGNHTFLRPVVFTQGQVFAGESLKLQGQEKGSLIVFNGKSWAALTPGKSGNALVCHGGSVKWSAVELSSTVGVLSVDKGGTGISDWKDGDIPVGKSGGISALPVGKKGHILTSNGRQAEWQEAPGLKGEGSAAYIPVWSDGRTLVNSPVRVTSRESIKIGENIGSLLLGEGTITFQRDRLRVIANAAELSIGDTEMVFSSNRPVFRVDKAGVLTLGIVPAQRLKGVVSVANGGTGMSSYRPGSLIYAVADDKLDALSTEHCEGFILQIVGGRPTLVPPSMIAAPQASSASALHPGLQLPNKLTIHPHAGAIEWSGDDLFFTGSNMIRRQIATTESDIDGTAQNVRGIVSLDHGGTGTALYGATVGRIVVIQSPTALGLLPTDFSHNGKFLRCNDYGMMPTWENVVTRIESDTGILIDSTNPAAPRLKLNASCGWSWAGPHEFQKGFKIWAGNQVELPNTGGAEGAPLRFVRTMAPYTPREGDMWYDGELRFCTGSSVVTVGDALGASVETHQLKVMECETPTSNTKRKAKYPLPYGNDPHNRCRWRIVRIDVRAEDAPTTGEAKLDVLVNGQSILETPLTIGVNQHAASVLNFINSFGGYSGDLVEIQYYDMADSDCCSVYMLVERVL